MIMPSVNDCLPFSSLVIEESITACNSQVGGGRNMASNFSGEKTNLSSGRLESCELKLQKNWGNFKLGAPLEGA